MSQTRLKEKLLKLLSEDVEFRYAVLGLLGIQEVLSAIKSLQEQVANNTSAIKSLQEQVAMHTEILEVHARSVEKISSKIDALGVRWGIITEETFRESIKYLVEDLLKIYKTDKWIHYDRDGFVYGYPSTVEADLLIKNKEHIIVEFKSHADRSDISELFKIGQLYGKITGVKPKMLMIASAIRRKAKELADKIEIECRGTVLEY